MEREELEGLNQVKRGQDNAQGELNCITAEQFIKQDSGDIRDQLYYNEYRHDILLFSTSRVFQCSLLG